MTAHRSPDTGPDRSFPTSVDVAIVGSGPSGAAYARILSELCPDASLVTFEVGPLLTDPPGTHIKNIVDDDARARAQRMSEGPLASSETVVRTADYSDESPRIARPGTFLLDSGYQFDGEDGLPNAAMSSNVGGMGAHWTGACPRPGDGERISSLDNLDELLDEAERLLGVDRDPFGDAPFAAEVRTRLADLLDVGRTKDRKVAPMPLAVTRHDDGRLSWSGSDVVYGDVTRHNDNHVLAPEALVTRVLTRDGAVEGVRVKDTRTGAEHDVRARFVVVAADSLRTPQLLWASGIRPEALGRYLNDQPQTVYAVRLRDVSEDAASEVDPRGRSTIVQQSGVSWVPYTDAEPFHGQVMQLDASPVPLAEDDVPTPGTIVGLGWFCGKELQASDRIEFDDNEMDRYGLPAMRIHYTLTDRDHDNIAAATAAVERVAHALGEPLGDKPFTFGPGASLHVQGTVRMGAVADGTSVCDPHSQVWDVERLHVAGNGVIPTSTACNPTLTSVALAVAGARHIALQLTHTSAALVPQEV
ncbi:GMC family oxidoreductase N-terminal domain-containing protein [Rhodococcus fascians]|nr:GMC family oxidoreductase N-terminal domain-containing protein [Rhodococcus fascians]